MRGVAVQETCAICGSDVPYSLTVHVLVHTGTDEGVVDHYVCRSCYEEQLAPLLAAGGGEGPADADAAAPPGADPTEATGPSDEPSELE